MRTVFVDSAGFYAVLDREDLFHDQATQIFERAESESWDLVTTNYVVHESWAVIQHRLGWKAVEEFLEVLLALCRVAFVDERLYSLGAARCFQGRSRSLSLTDCISFEFARQEQIGEAISDDKHFAREGLVLPKLR